MNRLQPFLFVGYRSRALGTTLGATILVILTWASFATLRWDAPMMSAQPQALFAAGPFRANEAFEQPFDATVNYLSYVETKIQYRARKSDLRLLFRLRHGDSLEREGILAVPTDNSEITTVHWHFDPIPESQGRRYSIQIVVGPQVTGEVFAMADLQDPLPGSLISNGISTDERIDLVIDPGRNANWWRIFSTVGRSTPIGIPGVLSLLALAAVTTAGGFTILFVGIRLVPAILIAAISGLVVLLTVSLALRIFMNQPSAELTSQFWIVIVASVLGTAGTPWIVAAISAVTGTLDSVRSASVANWLLAIAIILSASGLTTSILTAGERIHVAIPALADGQPNAGRFDLLNPGISGWLIRVACLIWAIYLVLIYLRRKAVTESDIGP
ncbi:MAG TPA: hypothetical protein DGO43_07590 [Chloroflexi bacterium]|nr:hypothetical protein [Chloroflexota bacterium]